MFHWRKPLYLVFGFSGTQHSSPLVGYRQPEMAEVKGSGLSSSCLPETPLFLT